MSARRVQFVSLRTKLLLFATALVVLPGAIVGAITVSRMKTALSSVVSRELGEKARDAADRLATTLRAERESLAAFAHQDVMREIRIGDLDKRISSFLASIQRGNQSVLDLTVLDRGDRVVASSNPSLIGTMQRSAANGVPTGATIEGPLEPPFHGRRSLRVSAPVPDPDAASESLGRLVGSYDWERETEVTARVRDNLAAVGLDADVSLVDAGGVVIGGALPPDGPRQVGTRLGLEAWREHAPDATPIGRVDPASGLLFGSASLADDLPSWTIVVSEPLSAALAPARQAARLLAFTLMGVLLAALAVALVAAARVTGPLVELTAAATEIGRGQAPVPTVPVRSRDEIGTLATAFNRMAVDLRRAERELVDAAKFAFVGELAAGVAHEVRTPLGVLRSSAQLLERSLDGSDDEARELLHLVRDEVDRIDHVVTGLLELGRPRELRPEASSLALVVFRAVDFAEVQAREKRVSVRRRPIDPDPVVRCDPELIYQVALNLLVNAIQILPEGGAIEIAVLPAHDGFAGFEVRDDGPGVPEELRERIFQPFFTRREGGAGLGLTFVQRVVQEHHGRVSVASAGGGGTVFRIELPAEEASI